MRSPTPPGTGVCNFTGSSGTASPCNPVSSLEIPTSIIAALSLNVNLLSKKCILPIAMTIMSVVVCTNNLEKKIEDQLKVAAQGLKFYTEYELKNGTATEISYDAEYIDILKALDKGLKK